MYLKECYQGHPTQSSPGLEPVTRGVVVKERGGQTVKSVSMCCGGLVAGGGGDVLLIIHVKHQHLYLH